MVDMLGTSLCTAQMPTDMRTEIVSAINGLRQPRNRCASPPILVITSSQYKVMH